MAGGILAWLGAQARNERLVQDLCNRVNGRVGYNYQWEPPGAGWYKVGYADYSRVRPAPSWISRWMGEEYEFKIVSVDLSNCAVSDDDMTILSRLRGIKEIDVSRTRISDSGLSALSEIRGLTSLAITGTDVTAEGTGALTRMQNLEMLRISGSLLSKEGVDAIKAIRSLRIVEIRAPADDPCWAIINAHDDLPGDWVGSVD